MNILISNSLVFDVTRNGWWSLHQHKKLHLKLQRIIVTAGRFWTDSLLQRNGLFLACLEDDSNGGGTYDDTIDYFYVPNGSLFYVKSPHQLPDPRINIVQVGILFYLKLL